MTCIPKVLVSPEAGCSPSASKFCNQAKGSYACGTESHHWQWEFAAKDFGSKFCIIKSLDLPTALVQQLMVHFIIRFPTRSSSGTDNLNFNKLWKIDLISWGIQENKPESWSGEAYRSQVDSCLILPSKCGVNTYLTGSVGFPGRPAGKESACNAGDPGLIPGSGSSPGEGIGYPLQYSWAFLVAQRVKNLPVIQETWVWSLSWEDPLEEGMATHSSILAWRIPMDRVWWATVHSGVKS